MGALIRKISLCIVCSVFWIDTPLCALSLQEGLDETLSKHPSVQEKLFHYKATLEDLRMSEASYLPSVDYTGYFAREKTDTFSLSRTLFTYEHSLQVTQNLFNGFGTLYEVDYQKARILAAAHDYVVVTNDVAYRFVQNYSHVLQAQKRLEIAKENVIFQEKIREAVGNLSAKYGKKMDAEVEKIDASLFLAESNYVVAQNYLEETLLHLARVLGRNIQASMLQPMEAMLILPNTYEEAEAFAKTHNPSILMSHYTIKAAQAQHQGAYQNYYPRIDAYLRQSWSDNTDGHSINEEQRSGGIQLSYNMYRGGADEALVEKTFMGVIKEEERAKNLIRQIEEQNRLSWSSKMHLMQQLPYLEQYVKTSYKTRELYEQEYAKNRRSLLELLVAHQDYVEAQMQRIRVEHELVLTQYRILDAMGVMVQTILGQRALEYIQRVAS